MDDSEQTSGQVIEARHALDKTRLQQRIDGMTQEIADVRKQRINDLTKIVELQDKVISLLDQHHYGA